MELLIFPRLNVPSAATAPPDTFHPFTTHVDILSVMVSSTTMPAGKPEPETAYVAMFVTGFGVTQHVVVVPPPPPPPPPFPAKAGLAANVAIASAPTRSILHFVWKRVTMRMPSSYSGNVQGPYPRVALGMRGRSGRRESG